VRPCDLSACDPRLPYRPTGRSVKFLTFEPEQNCTSGIDCVGGARDLNLDGDSTDLILQVLDLDSGRRRVVAAVVPESPSNPLQGGETGGQAGGGGSIFVASGRCIETLTTMCSTNADCAGGEVCDGGSCKHDHGVCASDDDCPTDVLCLPELVTAASPDLDEDGIPDHLDNCPNRVNSDQIDIDEDGAGDACDLATCGNGIVETDDPARVEQCDGSAASACPGAFCQSDCTCVCTNLVMDEKAKAVVTTKKSAGKLAVSMKIDLGTYAGEAVTVRLDDTDSLPIIRQDLATLPPVGTSGKVFAFKQKGDGLFRVALRQLKKPPGTYRLNIGAKHWFSNAAANQPGTSTVLTVTIGSQCFTLPATKKIGP
jgi:hypothetical protein